MFRSLQNPSDTSWLMAASVRLQPLQLGQSLQWGTATLRLVQLLFLFFFSPRTRWRWSLGLAKKKTFCVLSAEMWHTATPRPGVGRHTRCRRGAEDPRSNQSTLSCLVCACLPLQEVLPATVLESDADTSFVGVCGEFWRSYPKINGGDCLDSDSGGEGKADCVFRFNTSAPLSDRLHMCCTTVAVNNWIHGRI